MKTSEMYKGEFCLKKSPWPTLQVKDYPPTQKALEFVQGYLLSLIKHGKCPEPMKAGLAYKEEHLRKELKKDWNKFLTYE